MAILSANAVLDAIGDFYEDLLDREPSPLDLAFFLGAYRTDPNLDPIRATIARSSEARERVADLFEAVLDRPADAGGIAFFQAALASGASLDDVRAQLAQSPEARGVVNALYRDVLGRDGDGSGLVFFQGLLAGDDAEPDDVRASLALSDEAAQRINAVFQRVLGRDASPDGVAFFQTALAEDTFEFDDVAEVLAGSDELRGGLEAAYAQATGEALETDELEEYTERLASGDITLAELLPEIGALRPMAEDDEPSDPAQPETQDDNDGVVPIPPSSPAMTFLVPAGEDSLLTASSGADRFVFAKPSGATIIAGFDPAMDVLQFDPSTFADRTAFDAALADTPDGVRLSFPLGGSLLLADLDADDLTVTAVAFS